MSPYRQSENTSRFTRTGSTPSNSNRRGDRQMMCGGWYSATADAAEVPPGELKGCLSRAASLYLLASITASYLASSSAPTPLYPIYQGEWGFSTVDRKSTRLNSSHLGISYAVFCLKKKKNTICKTARPST